MAAEARFVAGARVAVCTGRGMASSAGAGCGRDGRNVSALVRQQRYS
jgi:hypothetical protein